MLKSRIRSCRGQREKERQRETRRQKECVLERETDSERVKEKERTREKERMRETTERESVCVCERERKREREPRCQKFSTWYADECLETNASRTIENGQMSDQHAACVHEVPTGSEYGICGGDPLTTRCRAAAAEQSVTASATIRHRLPSLNELSVARAWIAGLFFLVAQLVGRKYNERWRA